MGREITLNRCNHTGFVRFVNDHRRDFAVIPRLMQGVSKIARPIKMIEVVAIIACLRCIGMCQCNRQVKTEFDQSKWLSVRTQNCHYVNLITEQLQSGDWWLALRLIPCVNRGLAGVTQSLVLPSHKTAVFRSRYYRALLDNFLQMYDLVR
jgi:hypothetical protein